MQEPGVAEAEFARYDIKYVFSKTFGMRKPAALILPKDKSFFDSLDSDGTCPPWLSEEDISYYAEKFAKTGFTGGLNYYRCMDLYVSWFTLTILIFNLLFNSGNRLFAIKQLSPCFIICHHTSQVSLRSQPMLLICYSAVHTLIILLSFYAFRCLDGLTFCSAYLYDFLIHILEGAITLEMFAKPLKRRGLNDRYNEIYLS